MDETLELGAALRQGVVAKCDDVLMLKLDLMLKIMPLSGNDASYLSWVSSPKLASGSLRLVGVETLPAAVGPPLLLSLQLQLLHVVESLASVTLPCLGCLDVLVHRLLNVVTLYPQFA